MEPHGGGNAVLVTGAGGHIGREVCALLRSSGATVLGIDLVPDATAHILPCDVGDKEQVARVFSSRRIGTVIHLAAVLPTAFLADPLRGAAVNLAASCHVLREAVGQGVKRFLFASSVSVYGSSVGGRARHEDDPAIPDEPYGACKRAIEVVGETLAKNRALQFVSLRIARVVGPGAKTTSSPWRSQMLDPGKESIILPFAREAELSLVHVHDVARMLLILAEAEEIRDVVYNTPAEMWRVGQLQAAIQKFTGARVKVEPGKVQAGPTCDGRRFAREFGFRSAGLEEQLKAAGQASHSARHAPGR